MSFVNIISAVGNNSSIYPLLVRDCGIEIPTKVGMTYSQNLKDSKEMANNAIRERLIDEYGTSVIWLGGIPLIDWICNKFIRKLGYNPYINPKLFNDGKIQKNIEKYKNLASKEVEELKKVFNNKKIYERLLAGKFILSTTIPVALMGFVLPKANFKLTEKLRAKKSEKTSAAAAGKNPSFKGMSSVLANMSTVNKMAVTDGGLTVGRVATARNKYEKMEMAFKMLSMMFLNFVAPIWIAKGLDSASNKIFNTSVNLDPKILADKNFIEKVKNGGIKLPKNDIEAFLEKYPNETFSKFADKYILRGKLYKNGGLDPRTYIDVKSLSAFKSELDKFQNQALRSHNVEEFAKKALRIKSANILANVALSSFLLAVCLPKITFILRKKITGSDAEPGLVK